MLNPNDLFAQIGFIVQSPQKSSRSRSKKYHSGLQSSQNVTFHHNNNIKTNKYKTIQIEQDFQQPQYTTHLQIELGDDENHMLEIKSFDDPHELATKFCKKHNLNNLAIEIVEKKIIEAKNKQQDKLKDGFISSSVQKQSTPQKKGFQNKNQRTIHNNVNHTFLDNSPYRPSQNQKQKNPKNRPKSITPSKQQKSSTSNIKKSTKDKNSQDLSTSQTKWNKNKHDRAQQTVQKACDNLYFRGMIQAKALEQKRIKRQQEKQNKQTQELTFKPKINDVSQKIIQFRRQTGTIKPQNPSKIKKDLAQKFYKQLSQCTFTPQINEISKIIVHNRSAYRTQNQHFNQLFHNSSYKQKHINHLTNPNDFKGLQTLDSQSFNRKSKAYLLKKQQIQQKQLFKPKLNPKSIEQIKQPFSLRLQKAIQNKQKIKQGQYMNGQYSFQPQVGRAPYYQLGRGQNAVKNKQNIPVWEQLYKQSQNRIQKKKLQQKKKKQIVDSTGTNSRSNFDSELNHNNSRNSFSSAKASSSLHYENLVQKRINMVFQILDSDSDGLISPNTIGIQNLNKNILIFLKPIFEQMDEINAELNYNQFKKAVINLLNDSDPYKKGLFLSDNTCRKKKDNQNGFIPQINSKSRAMIEGRNTAQIHKQLYEQGVKNLQRKQFLLQRLRAKKQQQQLKQCSFKPCLKLGGKNYKPHLFDKKLEMLQNQFTNNNLSGNNYTQNDKEDERLSIIRSKTTLTRNNTGHKTSKHEEEEMYGYDNRNDAYEDDQYEESGLYDNYQNQ